MKHQITTLTAMSMLFARPMVLAQNDGAAPRISPRQAIVAVRKFMRVPDLDVWVEAFEKDSDRVHIGDTGAYGTHYTLRVLPGPYHGFYEVRASDGAMIEFDIAGVTDPSDSQDSVPQYSVDEGQAIAENYLKTHYPPFTRGHWVKDNNPDLIYFWRYTYRWSRVLNDRYGTLGPYGCYVIVDALRGAVTSYEVPRTEQIDAPTVPRVSEAQARSIAAKYAQYDPAQVPLIHPILRVGEDRYGDFYLSWKFYQVLDPADEPRIMEAGFTAEVDAMTGACRPSPGHFGGGPGVSKFANPHLIAAPPYTGISIKTLDGSIVTPIDRPTIEKGEIWSRVEALRGIGADVNAIKSKLGVSFGGKTVTNETAGARYHDHGWWIPLKRTLDALGLQMQWTPENKTVTIQCKAAQPQIGGRPAS